MPSMLFNSLGGAQAAGPMPDFGQVVQQFNQFRNNFQGDARQQVQQLLNSGQMTQQQYNELQNVARQFMALTGK